MFQILYGVHLRDSDNLFLFQVLPDIRASDNQNRLLFQVLPDIKVSDNQNRLLFPVLPDTRVSDTQNRLLFQVLHGVHVPGAQRVLDNRQVRETSGHYTFLHGDCSGCVVHHRVLTEVRSAEYTAIPFDLWGYILQ